MNYTVYLITNIINKKKYVGFTKMDPQKRFEQHTKRGFYLTKSIQKYGKEKFKLEIIVNNLSKREAIKNEIKFIQKYKTHNKLLGYNLTNGGDGIIDYKFSKKERNKRRKLALKNHKLKLIGMYGKKHSEETKKKISLHNPKIWLGKNISIKTKNKISKALKNKKRTQLQKENYSQALLRDYKSGKRNVKGLNNPMYGKKHSEETKQKIRQKYLQRIKHF